MVKHDTFKDTLEINDIKKTQPTKCLSLVRPSSVPLAANIDGDDDEDLHVGAQVPQGVIGYTHPHRAVAPDQLSQVCLHSP